MLMSWEECGMVAEPCLDAGTNPNTFEVTYQVCRRLCGGVFMLAFSWWRFVVRCVPCVREITKAGTCMWVLQKHSSLLRDTSLERFGFSAEVCQP